MDKKQEKQEAKAEAEVATPSLDKSPQRAMCVVHPFEFSAATCAICNDHYCEKCIVNHDGLNFCKEHFELFLSSDWDEIINLKTDPNNPEDGVKLFELHNQKWKEKGIPSYVSTHYKINFETDLIESYVKLFVTKEHAIEMSTQVQQVISKQNKPLDH